MSNRSPFGAAAVVSRAAVFDVALFVLVMAALLPAGCGEAEDAPAPVGAPAAPAAAGPVGGGQQSAVVPAVAAAARAGVISGTAKTLDGRPIKSFGGSISGYSAKSGQTQALSINGVDGQYATDVGPGQFAARAWTDVDYNGRNYRIDLHPADGKGGLTKQDTKDGLVKDFVWRLDGWRPGGDARSTDRSFAHYGGSISLNPEGHGVQYWSGIKKDYGHAAEPALPADATVTLTLAPDGPLIDGSAGKPVVLKLRGADIRGYMDRITRAIPIGRYKATATASLADGSSKPLRVTPYYQFKERDAPEPSTTATVEFLQFDPPSENVNHVDELVIHVMY